MNNEPIDNCWLEQQVAKEINRSEPNEVGEVFSEILYESPYDQPAFTDKESLRHLGYCGFGPDTNADVNTIRDERMLVNYYVFLQSSNCRECYERTHRDHKKAVHRASYALLSAISKNERYDSVSINLKEVGLHCSAQDMAKIILNSCQHFPHLEFDFEQCRGKINGLASELLYYFYGHIDHFSFNGTPMKQSHIE